MATSFNHMNIPFMHPLCAHTRKRPTNKIRDLEYMKCSLKFPNQVNFLKKWGFYLFSLFPSKTFLGKPRQTDTGPPD